MPVSHARVTAVTSTDDELPGLLEVLARVPDPRRRRGRRYTLVFMLVVAVACVLAGAKNFREIGDQAANQAGSRRDRVRRPGTNCRHRVRRTLRHVRSARHERLQRVRQLHRQGRQSQWRLQLHCAPRERHPAVGSSRHDRPGRRSHRLRPVAEHGSGPATIGDHGRSATSSRSAMAGSTRWGNLRPPGTLRAKRGST